MTMRMIVLVVGLVLISAAMLYGCGGNRELTRMTADDSISKLEPIDKNSFPVDSADSSASETTELVALADTLEEAEEIATLYGIELSSYSYGVATYTTDKSAQELIEFGAENGYPELSPNYENMLYTEP